MSSSEELQSLEGLLRCLISSGFIPTVGEMLTARSFFSREEFDAE